MCGISGAVGNRPVDSTIVETAAREQQHRGPDHFQSAVFDGGCFCHNRLSLIDLSDRSNQPLSDESGILVFNGEIYNFRELAKKYLSENDAFSDTLTLFAMLKTWGTSILPELDGMFAFAWYNRTEQRLLLARDRFGIKPLYFSQIDNHIFFASEIKTLLHLLESLTAYHRSSDISDDFIADCIAYGHAESGSLPFKSIQELQPGTSTDISLDSLSFRHEPRRYFSIPETVQGSPFSRWKRNDLSRQVNALDTLLRDSVALHLISDAPLGVLCSGGLDSSLVTAIAATMSDKVSIYHATVDSGNSELPYAEMVAKRYNLTLNTIVMTPERFRDSLVDSIYHLDVPMYHPSDISLHTISRKAHEDGVKGLLCGEGSDELFGGYGWFDIFNRSASHFPLLNLMDRGIDLFHRALRFFRYADQFTKEELFIYSGNYLPHATRNVPEFAKRTAFLHNRRSWQVLRSLESVYRDRDSHPHLAAFITSNCYGHLSSLLQRNDRMCMQASIESRVPFIENGLINFALNLDSSWKLHGRQGKYLLKKVAEKYLPRAVIYRKKAGFPVPWEQYAKTVHHRIFDNGFICRHFDCSAEDIRFWTASDHNLLFTALSLEIWGRLFVNRESRDAVKELVR